MGMATVLLVSLVMVSQCLMVLGIDTCGRPRVDMLSSDNEQGTSGARIVGGFRARPGSHPWIVSLSLGYGHHCAGTLIRVSEKDETDIVVTAAHCVYKWENDQPTPIIKTVTAGLHFISRWWAIPKSDLINVNRTVIIEGHIENRNSSLYDIAVLKLETPIKFNDIVQPGCLPEPNVNIPNGTELIVAGWGYITEFASRYSKILMQVSLPVISHEDCNARLESLGKPGINSSVQICAGGLKQGGKDACQGDSGGPGVVRKDDIYVLEGVVSSGPEGCAHAGVPGIFTRVSKYVCWIYDQVKKYSDVYKCDRKSGDRGFMSAIHGFSEIFKSTPQFCISDSVFA